MSYKHPVSREIKKMISKHECALRIYYKIYINTDLVKFMTYHELTINPPKSLEPDVGFRNLTV